MYGYFVRRRGMSPGDVDANNDTCHRRARRADHAAEHYTAMHRPVVCGRRLTVFQHDGFGRRPDFCNIEMLDMVSFRHKLAKRRRCWTTPLEESVSLICPWTPFPAN